MSNPFFDISLRTIELHSQLNQVFHFGASLRRRPNPATVASDPCYPGSRLKIRLT
jgi:hypothetical protein